jgi:alanine dehydrogenase
MIIGIPKEIKNGEKRVAIVPAGVKSFVKFGHQVLIEKGAGLGSHITDDEYISAGAEIVISNKEIYQRAMKSDKALKKGLNVFKGKIVCKPVAEAMGLECSPFEF